MTRSFAITTLVLAALVTAGLFPPGPARALEAELSGQLSGWVRADSVNHLGLRMGLRYIPTLSLSQTLGGEYLIDLEASVNAWASLETDSFNENETDADVEPYRLWVRFSGPQMELRAGLQKINFGPARLLRALRWFDQLDPRDPLGLTDGVYGLLSRYYFLNNANIWLWALYGNEETKGWEAFTTLEDSVEFGGRIQLPLWDGEIAAAYHRRWADLAALGLGDSLSKTAENRFGLDGRWDFTVGVWFEAVWMFRDGIEAESVAGTLRHERFLNLGLDYTFDLGNGLGAALEHLIRDFSAEPWESDQGVGITALSLSYPLGLTDTLGAIIYYDWNENDLYAQLSWRKVFDNWTLHLIGFANPESGSGAANTDDNLAASGKGVMVVFSFNH